MQPLTEKEMGEITGQAGFSEFTVDATTARMFLNISVETNAYIDEFKANYDLDAEAWDQEWYEVYLGEYDAGEPVNPLVLEGFILEAEFDDITAANKRLLSLKMGFENVSGEISALDFASFTGYYGNPTRASYYRASAGGGTFTFDDDRIHMIFDARGLDADGNFSGTYPPGIYFDFGNAEFN